MRAFRQKKAGQSILEVAIFGAILLAIMSVLLQYGLKFNYQQRAMMRAFRRSLAESGDPYLGGMGSYTYLQDRHVPSPAAPSAVGGVFPFSSGASVTRNYRMIETPDTERELPITVIDINDERIYRLKTAGFRRETITKSNYDKYKEVFGDLYIKRPNGDLPFEEDDPDSASATVQIMDSCQGQMISYDGCKRQCRMITVRSFCRRECERGKAPGDDKDCGDICSQTVRTPWYCSRLDSIFDQFVQDDRPKTMGIQPDTAQSTSIRDTLRKSESGGSITTRDSLNWATRTDRTMVYYTGGRSGNVVQRPVRSTLGESVTQRCTEGNCN